MLNLNNITSNKRLGNLIGRCLEMPYDSYCHPLDQEEQLRVAEFLIILPDKKILEEKLKLAIELAQNSIN